MRKRLGKIMVVLLCLSLILFVGCDKTETGKEQEGIGTDKQKEVEKSVTKDKHEPEPGKKYVLEWAITNTHQLAEDPTVVKYFEEKMNVKFNVWSFDPTTQYEQLGLKIASGEVPDVWTVSSWSNYESFADQGVLYEIDEDVIKKYAPNLFKMYKDENPNSFKYFRINGKLYGLSGYRDHYLFNRTPVVWRGDWLEKVGISKTPETIDEFEEALYKFTKEDPDGNGENDTYGLSTSAISLFYGAFGQPRDIWFEKDGKLAYSTVQPEVKDTLAFLAKLYEDGIIDPEFITGENEGGYWGITHAFINGKIGLTSHGVYYHWTVSMYEGHPGSFNYVEMKKINPEAADRLVFGLPPKGPSGNMGVVQEQPIPGSGNVFGISIEKDPGKLGKILQIFDFIYENEINYLTARRGIKGVHWEFDDRGNYQYINDWDLGKTASLGANTLFACCEPIKYMGKTSKEFGEKYRFNEGGVISKLYTSLPSAAQYQTELNTLLSGAITEIITGEKPVSYYDEIIQKWHSSGGDILTKEANAWYETVK